ncbi:hypothetical protein QFZ32_006203 [Streptomyces canus]|nr:hypothetical protein [Streptomyces canus]
MIKLLRRPGLPSRRFSPEPPPRSNCPAGYAPRQRRVPAVPARPQPRQRCPLVLDGRLRQPRKGTSPLRFCAFAIPAATISSRRWMAMPLRTIDGRGPPQRRPPTVQVEADGDRGSGGECGPGLRSGTSPPCHGPSNCLRAFPPLAAPGSVGRPARTPRREPTGAVASSGRRTSTHRLTSRAAGHARSAKPSGNRLGPSDPASHEASRGVRWSVRSNPLPDGRLMRPGDIDHRGQKPTDVILPPEIRLVRLAAGSP